MPSPAGPLLIDEWTGQQHVVGRLVVIGSQPDRDQAAISGDATMIRIDGPEVDEVHVRIRADGDTVTAETVGGGAAWIQQANGPLMPLGPDPAVLSEGSHLRVGTRTLVFRAAPDRGR